MNILQDIDATLHYENIENAWKKHKYSFISVLVLIFAGTAGYNTYHANTVASSKNDTNIIFETILNNSEKDDYIQTLEKSIDSLKTVQAKESLALEIAKAYKKENNIEKYESSLITLTNAKTNAVRNISAYMLAELYLSQDAEKAISFIDSYKLSKKEFAYNLMQELKAMALTKKGDTETANTIYTSIIVNPSSSQELVNRAKFKQQQLTK